MPVTRDPRLDKAITWGLTAFCGFALSISAWFIQDLKDEVSTLRTDVANLRVDIEVLKVRLENRHD